jgi:hypothetical protein
MAKRNGKKNVNGRSNARQEESEPRLHHETKNSIWAISFVCVAIILILAGFAKAGPAGALIYRGLDALFGWGYFILPATLFFAALVFAFSKRREIVGITLLGAVLLILSFLGAIEILSPGHGGWLGLIFGSLRAPFGTVAAMVIDVFILIIAILVTANVPLRIKWPKKEKAPTPEEAEEDEKPILVTGAEPEVMSEEKSGEQKDSKDKKEADGAHVKESKE